MVSKNGNYYFFFLKNVLNITKCHVILKVNKEMLEDMSEYVILHFLIFCPTVLYVHNFIIFL